MKKLITAFFTAIFTLTIACGCSDKATEAANRLAEAQDAIAVNDVDAAIHILHNLNDLKDEKGLTVSQLGRMSILYMQLTDRTDDSDNVDYAVNCYREAFALNPDSARAFYSSLPREDDKYVIMLAGISGNIDNPPSLEDAEEPDSIPADSFPVVF